MKKRISFFAIIGLLNTAIDAVIYTLLRHAHLAIWSANMISTSSALIFSFFMNRHFTFSGKGKNKTNQLIKFIPVSIIGLWVIQPLLIYGLTYIGTRLSYIQMLEAFMPISLPGALYTALPKLIATGGSLVWNFYMYNYFVFRAHLEE